MNRRDAIEKILSFLEAIDIPFTKGVSNAEDCFVPGVRIVDGTLEIDVKRAHPADILHEAGHLAVLPAAYRPKAQTDIESVIEQMCAETVDLYPVDSPELRAVMQSGEVEATAWAYAAGVHLGLRPRQIIDDHHYENTGAHVRLGLSMNAYFGINGLVHGGMCKAVKAYPEMLRWTQI